MILTPVTEDLFEEIKPAIWPLLEKGVEVDNGRVTAEQAWNRITSGKSHLWVVAGDSIKALVMTALIDYPQFKACEIELCVGEDRHEWLHLLSQLEDWAREQGCEYMEGLMRPGWKLNGYRVRRHMTEKRL